MKVVYAGIMYDYNDKRRGYSYEYTQFNSSIAMIEQVDYKYFDTSNFRNEKIQKSRNEELMKLIDSFQPEILLYTFYHGEIYKETFDYIRKNTNTKLVWFVFDDFWRFDTCMKEWCWYFDYLITTDSQSIKKYDAIGYHKTILSNFGYAPSIYKNKDLEYKYDISFVGQPHSNRREIIKELSKRGIHVNCFGQGWNQNLIKKLWNKGMNILKLTQFCFNTGRITQDEMINIFNQSKINLNFTGCNSLKSPNKVNGRFFEIIGCGAFMLCEQCLDSEKFLEDGTEYVSFRDINDLEKKIRYYLQYENERNNIANSGFKRAALYSYDQIFNRIFNNIVNSKDVK